MRLHKSLLKGRSYTDDLMPGYGDHESTEDPLHILRHSTAHLLAAAVTELYPDAKYGIGPPVDDGFYYDFAFSKPISESDLGAIESRMRRIAQEDRPFVKETMSRKEAIDEFRSRGQEQRFARERDPGAFDEDAETRGGIAERVDHSSRIHRGSYTDGLMAESPFSSQTARPDPLPSREREPDAEPIDPGSEDGKHRGQKREGVDDRDGDHDRPRRTHRGQEGALEEELSLIHI